MKDILVLLENKISDYDNKIRDINKELNKLNSMYVKIKPKSSKELNYYACNNFTYKEIDMLDEITLNVHPINRIYTKITRLDDEIKRLNSVDGFLSNNRSFATNIRSQDINHDAVVLQKKRDLLSNKMIEMGCKIVVSTYENYANEKEKLTDSKKRYIYILRKFTKKERINAFEIGLLSELISDSNLDNKEDKLSEIENYTKSFEVKKENNNLKEEKKEKVHEIKPFEDSNLSEEKNNDDFDFVDVSDVKNYASVLNLFKNEEEIISYLEGISYFKNFNKILSMMLDYAKDEKTKEIIENYILSKKEDTLCDKVCEENTIFYYDYKLSSHVFKDIESIPKELYKDVLSALNEIKKDGAINKREQVNKLRKVLKIRKNEIRVTFRRIDKNVYVILGVFVKKDNKGFDIINTTEKRNEKLNKDIPALLSLRKDKDLWNECSKDFDDIENEIMSLLNPLIK